jgi:large subunit ribosomal protein L21e
MLREYSEGDRALVIIDSRQHKGLPHRRYHGKVGVIKNVGRRSITLDVKLGNKTKTLITRFDHVKPFGVL